MKSIPIIGPSLQSALSHFHYKDFCVLALTGDPRQEPVIADRLERELTRAFLSFLRIEAVGLPIPGAACSGPARLFGLLVRNAHRSTGKSVSGFLATILRVAALHDGKLVLYSHPDDGIVLLDSGTQKVVANFLSLDDGLRDFFAQVASKPFELGSVDVWLNLHSTTIRRVAGA